MRPMRARVYHYLPAGFTAWRLCANPRGEGLSHNWQDKQITLSQPACSTPSQACSSPIRMRAMARIRAFSSSVRGRKALAARTFSSRCAISEMPTITVATG